MGTAVSILLFGLHSRVTEGAGNAQSDSRDAGTRPRPKGRRRERRTKHTSRAVSGSRHAQRQSGIPLDSAQVWDRIVEASRRVSIGHSDGRPRATADGACHPVPLGRGEERSRRHGDQWRGGVGGDPLVCLRVAGSRQGQRGVESITHVDLDCNRRILEPRCRCRRREITRLR